MRCRAWLALAAPAMLFAYGLVSPLSVAADPPVVADDTATVAEDSGATTVDVLANDTDPDLTIVSVTQGGDGSVVIEDPLSLTYAPEPNFHGSDTFTYTVENTTAEQSTATVTMTVTSVNDGPPVAVDDPGTQCGGGLPGFGGSFPIPEDWHDPFILTDLCGLLANDIDVDGDGLTWELVDDPTHGEALFLTDDMAAYTPDPDYSTPAGTWLSDSFTYRAFDGTDFSNVATMKFWIAPINDPPTFTPGTIHIDVDEDSGAYEAPWATNVSAGPANESDQTVTFEIEDLDATALFSSGPSIAEDGTLSFTPAPDANGIAHFKVHAHDDGGLDDYDVIGPFDPPDDTSDDVTFDITIDPVNDAPVADNESVTVNEDTTSSTVNVLTGDTDVDHDSLVVSNATNGSDGTVSVNPNKLGVRYTPAPNYFGTDTFTYTVSDGHGGTDIGIVSVTITQVNDNPVAGEDGVPTPLQVAQGGGPTALPVLANDNSGPDPIETLTITGVTEGTIGHVEITGGGSGLTYDPIGSLTGNDTFTYTISDGNGGEATALVHVHVADDITGPVATAPRVVVSARIGASSVRASLVWSATDTQSGISLYQLQQQIDGGAWTTILSSPTATRTSVTLATGKDYRFRVRAKDGTNNLGAYATSRLIHL